MEIDVCAEALKSLWDRVWSTLRLAPGPKGSSYPRTRAAIIAVTWLPCGVSILCSAAVWLVGPDNLWSMLAVLLVLLSIIGVDCFYKHAVIVPVSNLLKDARHIANGERVSQERLVGDEFARLHRLINGVDTLFSEQARSILFDTELKAIEGERRRVAKELHDEILPSLARAIRSIKSADGEHANQLIEELHETVGAFRDVLGELHPVDLEELGLVESLQNLCTRYRRLTGLFVVFIEESEECRLTEHQQLCVYRAVQSVLRMFTESGNDILILSYNRQDDITQIDIRCVDKKVSSAEWVSVERQDFNSFEAWCSMAGAEVRFSQIGSGDFPSDLVISVEESFKADEHE